MAVDLSRITALSEGLRERNLKAKQGDGKAWYRVNNKADKDTAEIYIYDFIGEWGVTAQDFVNELRDIKTSKIDLHLNCGGGQVWDGLAIYAALRNHDASVTAYVDALAASAASFIAQAGDKRIMEPNARMMIHDAHGICIGTADDMREMAKMLADTSDNIAGIYADRSGTEEKNWRKAMKNTTWYSAEEAVEAGLADEVAGSEDSPGNKITIPQIEEKTEALSWGFDIQEIVKGAVA